MSNIHGLENSTEDKHKTKLIIIIIVIVKMISEFLTRKLSRVQ